MSEGAASRWREVNPGWATPVVGALAAIAFAGLLYLTRRFDFFFDEWDFVLGEPHWGLRDYFLPHAEHWSTVPALIYTALFSVVGARTYLPFMAVLLLMHAVIAGLLYALIRRRDGALLGLLAAALLLFLGRGWENLIWAFQIGFLGSVLFGLAAWVLLDRPTPRSGALAAACLLLSVMSSGVGLFYVAAVAAELAVDRSRRRWLGALAPTVAAYLVWFGLIGHRYQGVHRSPYSLTALRSLVTYVPTGLGAAAVGLFGFGLGYAPLGLAGLAALAAFRFLPPRPWPSARVIGAVAGLLAQYVLIGLVRAQLGDFEAASPRYVYIAATFLLPVLAEAAGPLRWRPTWRPAVALVTLLAVGWSGYHFLGPARDREADLARQKAELATLWAVRDAPDLNQDAVVEPNLMPQVRVKAYLDGRSVQGSTAPDLSFEQLGSEPAGAVDRELDQVLRFRFATTSAPLAGTGCGRLDPALGYTDVSAQDGEAVTVESPVPGPVRIYAWVFGASPPEDRPVVTTDVPPGERLQLTLPVTGHGATWHVRTYPPPYSDATACVG